MKDLAQVLFSLPLEAADAVANLLTEEGTGLQQRDHETTPTTDDKLIDLLVWLPVGDVERKVKQVEILLSSLKRMGTQVDPWSWRSEAVDPKSWEDAYKKFFKVNRLGRHFVVKPSWEEYEAKPQELIIGLDPGLAFGTGLHPSTRLAIHLMERVARNGIAPMKILDMGCGTGILAIAAAKLWPACRVIAIDNDEIAVQVCKENVSHNNLNARIVVQHRFAGEIKETFDLVLANLTSDILSDLQPIMRNTLEDFGHLILSGLTAEQATKIACLYGHDMVMEPTYSEERDGWRALLLRVRT